VPQRDIPDRPWRTISLAVTILVLLATAAWEWQMRRLGLTAGDLGDNPYAWVEQRRRIDTEPVSAAIVGDSRILFDTDLDHFQRLTGIRPLQLALPGTNGRPFLENLADDPNFKGLVIVGMTDVSYFREKAGWMKIALELAKFESPAKRGSFLIGRQLEMHLAFLEQEYRLSALVARLDPNWRAGVEGPYDDTWKLSTTLDGRQTFMWPRIEHDERLRAHGRAVWQAFEGPVVKPEVIAMTLKRTRVAVAKIRARGGDVLFVRPPSAPDFRANEDKRLPRAKGWDALLIAARAKGVHIDDMPTVQGLWLPEGSHLSKACATVFTDAYVRSLAELSPRLVLRPDAPPPLTTKDCAEGR
jgi:hypothetical protein